MLTHHQSPRLLVAVGSLFRPAAPGEAREAILLLPPREVGGGDAMRDAQADVPSARRLRAQLAFKDSMVHGILQFTPSIAFRYVLHRCESRDIRCRESFNKYGQVHDPRAGEPGAGGHAMCSCSLARSAPGFVVSTGVAREGRAPGVGRGQAARGRMRPSHVFKRVHGSFCMAVFDNDPSAGSPTETLLRLLLPLNDKVQWTSRDVAGGEPPTSPRSEHFTGPFNR